MAVTEGSLKISTVLFVIKTSTNKPRMWTSSPWWQVGRPNRNSTLHKHLKSNSSICDYEQTHSCGTQAPSLHRGELPVQHICPSEPTGATALRLKLKLHISLMRTMTKNEIPMSISFILMKHIAAFTFITKHRQNEWKWIQNNCASSEVCAWSEKKDLKC